MGAFWAVVSAEKLQYNRFVNDRRTQFQIIRMPRFGFTHTKRSLKKARVIAKKVSEQINEEKRDDSSSNYSSSDDEVVSSPISNFKQLCQNGKCTWKVRDKYDDICTEIQEADQANKR